MSDTPPLSWDDALRLISLVHAAQTMADLDVRPVRVWRLLARCDDHGGIEDERITDIAEMPSNLYLKCHLCACGFRQPMKAAQAFLIRG